jgi:hypothetical protein
MISHPSIQLLDRIQEAIACTSFHFQSAQFELRTLHQTFAELKEVQQAERYSSADLKLMEAMW